MRMSGNVDLNRFVPLQRIYFNLIILFLLTAQACAAAAAPRHTHPPIIDYFMTTLQGECWCIARSIRMRRSEYVRKQLQSIIINQQQQYIIIHSTISTARRADL